MTINYDISTHSLTKRLTSFSYSFKPPKSISTHSLTKRLTFYEGKCTRNQWYFNSQPHEEADFIPTNFADFCSFQLTASRRGWQHINVWPDQYSIISTHSLTKRLTIVRIISFIYFLFQLTASRRGWRWKRLYYYVWYWHFNSQPHEEADKQLSVIFAEFQHFNSQPHEEADVYWVLRDYITMTFQLTASRRGWLYDCQWYYTSRYFNSQPHEEADIRPVNIWKYFWTFQLTASRRGWLLPPFISPYSRTFQLTASRRGWRINLCL